MRYVLFIGLTLAGITQCTSNAFADLIILSDDGCTTPTIDYIHALAKYKGLDDGWGGENEFCLLDLKTNPKSWVFYNCQKISDAERKEADNCH